MKNELRSECWEIIGAYHGEDPGHGLPHIQRAFNNFQIFKRDNPPVNPVILEVLEPSILFHDIGTSRGWRNHAANSVKILKKTGLSRRLPHWEMIAYAIANHSRGLQGKPPKDDKDLCLGLLVVMDHLDALGSIGIYRSIRALGGKIPLFPEYFDPEEAEKIVNCWLRYPREVTIDCIGWKESSFLEQFLYNYCITFEIVPPVRDFLGKRLTEIIQNRLKTQKMYIMDLCQERS